MGGPLDLTSEQARERLLRLFRHAQVGLTVSSVTHDVNNYLGAIMAYAELASMDANISPDSARMLNQVNDAVRKAATLVNTLTDVARKERRDVRIMEPSHLVERTLDLRRYDLRVSNIAHETQYEPGLPALALHLPRMQLALIYLITNAIEALEGQERRTLKISARRDGEGVAIAVKDSAPPIDSDVCACMFEAFFTTKGDDHLGLGLTAARALLEEHGGSLEYSEVEGFVCRLPLITSYAS